MASPAYQLCFIITYNRQACHMNDINIFIARIIRFIRDNKIIRYSLAF